jgi:hypothetical protein
VKEILLEEKMNKHQFTLLFTSCVLLTAVVVDCAAPPTPTPTPAPTATRPPQPTATVPAPTAAPTVAPTATVVSDPAKALAPKRQGAVVLEDSFEKGTVGEFPSDWNILDKDAQVAAKTGPRVLDGSALKGPDGKSVIHVQSNPQVDGRMNRDFTATSQGRLFWSGMIPSKDGNFLSLELRDGGTLMFNLEMHPEGRFRYRDEGGNLQETNVKLSLDKWYTLVSEWDSTASIWNGYVLDDSGKQLLLTPEKGVPFPAASKGKAPNRVQLRLNRAAQIVGSYIDNIKIYSLQ